MYLEGTWESEETFLHANVDPSTPGASSSNRRPRTTVSDPEEDHLDFDPVPALAEVSEDEDDEDEPRIKRMRFTPGGSDVDKRYVSLGNVMKYENRTNSSFVVGQCTLPSRRHHPANTLRISMGWMPLESSRGSCITTIRTTKDHHPATSIQPLPELLKLKRPKKTLGPMLLNLRLSLNRQPHNQYQRWLRPIRNSILLHHYPRPITVSQSIQSVANQQTSTRQRIVAGKYYYTWS